jgi:hypothetical protein
MWQKTGLEKLVERPGPAFYLRPVHGVTYDLPAVWAVAPKGYPIGLIAKDDLGQLASGDEIGVCGQRWVLSEGAPAVELCLVPILWAPDGEVGSDGRSSPVMVAMVGDGRWAVTSRSWRNRWREVLIEDGNIWCSCPSGQYRPSRTCRHMKALRQLI